MDNTKSRKYSRTVRKSFPSVSDSNESELSFSSTAALGILGGTFLIGVITGKLLGLCRHH
jgi:hypothetical protein